jgi:membrane protease subunit HflC
VKNRLTLITGGLIVLVLLLKMMVYTVKDSETVVLLTFGKPTAESSQPGLNFKLPWPIQAVKPFDARLRVLRSPLEEMSTKDERAILIGSFVLWRISSGKTFLEAFPTPEHAERYLQRRLRNQQIAAVSGMDFGGLVSANREELRYEELEARMRKGLAADAAASGIEVAMVGIRQLSLPQAATEAVFDRMRADRRKLATKILEQGRAQADAIKRDAEERSARLLIEAKRDARDMLSEADRATGPHYATMAKDPELAVFLKKLEALEKLLRGGKHGGPTIIFDTSQPPFDLLRPKNGE